MTGIRLELVGGRCCPLLTESSIELVVGSFSQIELVLSGLRRVARTTDLSQSIGLDWLLAPSGVSALARAEPQLFHGHFRSTTALAGIRRAVGSPRYVENSCVCYAKAVVFVPPAALQGVSKPSPAIALSSVGRDCSRVKPRQGG